MRLPGAVVRLPLSRQGGGGRRPDPPILEPMTATTESSSLADRAPDTDTLRGHLLEADPGVLVAVLAQMTGDTSVIDRYAAKIDHVPDPPERSGTTDRQTAETLAEEIIAALGRPRPAEALPIDDRGFFARLLPIALGSAVDDEHVDLLLEQGGFRPSHPTLPRTTPIPSSTTVAIIGAGIAGIAVALAAAEEGVRFAIFDRNDEVGGTWLTTTYPGIGVDTPSAYYSLSREVNPDWSNYYPQGAEYQDYLVSLADKHDLRRHIRFNTEVEALWWDEERGQWEIHSLSADGAQSINHATVVVTAAGYLNRPRFPDISGRDTFAGISIHSAQWDSGLDLAGKKVAVIGAGCTAVQIVDACVDEVEHLTAFQRQPHWVAPRKRLSDEVPEHRRYLGRVLPYYAMWHRLKSYWGTADNNYPVILQDPEWSKTHLSISPANDVLLQMCRDYIERMFGAGTELAKKVTPDFAPYGKRIIRDPGGYYAALTRDHVDVEASEPAAINERGIVTADGRQIDLDVIIYATGYHLDFLSTVDIRGRDGKTLVEEWRDRPPRVPRRHGPGIPESVHHLGPQLQPGAWRGRQFLDGSAGALHHGVPATDGVAWGLDDGSHPGGLRGLRRRDRPDHAGHLLVPHPQRPHLLPVGVRARRGGHAVPVGGPLAPASGADRRGFRSPMSQILSGKTALVTGSSRGIGRAIAQRLAAEGATVAVTARAYTPTPSTRAGVTEAIPGTIDETIALIEQAGGSAFGLAADLEDSAARDRLVEAVIERTGRLDILVNNAGYADYSVVEDMAIETFDRTVKHYLKTPFALTKAAVPHMRSHGAGWIVNIGSVTGVAPVRP